MPLVIVDGYNAIGRLRMAGSLEDARSELVDRVLGQTNRTNTTVWIVFDSKQPSAGRNDPKVRIYFARNADAKIVDLSRQLPIPTRQATTVITSDIGLREKLLGVVHTESVETFFT